MTTYPILLIISLSLMAFFAGNEIGLISCQFPRVLAMVKNGSSRAKWIHYILKRPELMLSTMLVGTNICLTSGSVFAQKWLISLGMTAKTSALLISVFLPIIMLLPEILPKSWFRQNPEEQCTKFAPLLLLLYFILLPFSYLMTKIINLSLRLMHKAPQSHSKSLLLREDFRVLIRDSENVSAIDSEAADILDRSLDFYNLFAENICTPVNKIFKVEDCTTISEAMKICQNHKFSHLPVMTTSPSTKWVGIFSIYDVVFMAHESDWSKHKVADYMIPLCSVAGKAGVSKVIAIFNNSKSRMLAVIAKDKKIIGFITPHDVSKYLFPT